MLSRFLRGLLIAALALPANASRDVAVKIEGVDDVCSSFSVSTVSNASIYTCVPQSSQPGAPAGCTATVNSSTSLTLTSAGGNANFAASCSTPTSGITWNWSKNSVFGASTSASWTDSLGSNASPTVDNLYRYQARACNQTSCTTFPSTPLLVTVNSTGGGGGGFNGSCGGFDNTVVLTLDWDTPVRVYTNHLGANDAVVVTFTTGNVGTTTSLPRIAGAEHNSAPSSRIAKLSTLPCDFGNQAAAGSNIQGNTVNAVFAITPGSGFSYYAVLAKNTTYYLNVRNSSSSTTCIANGECSMFFDLIGVGGL